MPVIPEMFITGGRGRLARLLLKEFSTSGLVRAFSRRSGDGMFCVEELFHPHALKPCDVLLHLAWSSVPKTAEQQPGLSENEDLPMLQRLLIAIRTIPASRRPHLVFFSSGGAVYGNAPGRPNIESDECRPIGQYGRVKRAAEVMIESWAVQHNLSYTILRISNPYGYIVSTESPQGVIPRAINCALSGNPLTLWGDGTARKDYLYHTDMLSALATVIARRPIGTFNLCSGISHSVREVLTEIESQTGKIITLAFSPAAAWDVQESRLANDRLCAVSDWKPRISLGEGIRLSVRSYQG